MELDSYGTYMGQSVETEERARKAWKSLLEWGVNGYHWTGTEDYDDSAPLLIDSLKSARNTNDLACSCVVLVGALVAIISPVLVEEGWLTRRTVTVLSGASLIGAYVLYRTASPVWAIEAEIVKRIESHMDLAINLAKKQPFDFVYDKVNGSDTKELSDKISSVLIPLVQKCAPKNSELLGKVENFHSEICKALSRQKALPRQNISDFDDVD